MEPFENEISIAGLILTLKNNGVCDPRDKDLFLPGKQKKNWVVATSDRAM